MCVLIKILEKYVLYLLIVRLLFTFQSISLAVFVSHHAPSVGGRS